MEKYRSDYTLLSDDLHDKAWVLTYVAVLGMPENFLSLKMHNSSICFISAGIIRQSNVKIICQLSAPGL